MYKINENMGTCLCNSPIYNSMGTCYYIVTNKTTEQTAKGENEVAKAYRRHQRNTDEG